MPWVGNISDIPDGWIVCDGTQISASDFPLLARAIGDTYNLSTTVTQGLIDTFTSNVATEAGRIPDTYIYSPIDGSGGGATFAVIVGDAGTQGGGLLMVLVEQLLFKDYNRVLTMKLVMF